MTITENSRYSNVYACLFFLLGLTLRLPGRYSLASWALLIFFYMLHHGVLQRDIPMKHSFIIFFAGCAVFFLHLAITTLAEIFGKGYVPFHGVYESFGGVRRVVALAGNFAGSYVIFRCLQMESNDRLLCAFARGGGVYSLIFFLSFKGFINMEGRLSISDEAEGYNFNANQIAYLYVLFFYFNVLAFHYARRYWAKICHMAFSGIALGVVVLTQSRSSLAALLIGLFLPWCFSKKRVFMSCLAVISLLIFCYAAGYQPGDWIPQRYTVKELVEKGGSDRTTIWRDYLRHATMRDWLIGRGNLGTSQVVLYQKPLRHMRARTHPGLWRQGDNWRRISYPHNAYLQVLLLTGIGGLVFYCYLALKILSRLFKKAWHKKIHWAFLSLWCAFLIWGTGEGDFLGARALIFWAAALSQAFPQDVCLERGPKTGEKRRTDIS